MIQENGALIIEPIEDFLASVYDPDRLSLYQRVIDIIKLYQKYSMIDSLNSILTNAVDDSPGELGAEIHVYMISLIADILLEYDIVVVKNDLPFLVELAEILFVLDVYDAHEHIVNTIEYGEGKVKRILYEVFQIVKYVDEEKYYQTVQTCSMSLLDKIKAIHQKALDEEDAEQVVPTHDLSIVKHIYNTNNGLILNRLVDENIVKIRLDPEQLTPIILREFEDIESMQPKEIARELIAVYSVSGLSKKELTTAIRNELPNLVSNDHLISLISGVLDNIYVEMTT